MSLPENQRLEIIQVIDMKKIKLFVFIIGCFLLPRFMSAQIRIEKQLYVEIKDTVEVAYHHYYTGEWSINTNSVYPVVKKDSIGLDSVRITRLYYLVDDSVYHRKWGGSYEKKKVFIDFIVNKKYLSKRKGNDYAENYYD